MDLDPREMIGRAATRQLRGVMENTDFADRYPDLVEYLEFVAQKVPTRSFLSSRETMRLRLKGLDIVRGQFDLDSIDLAIERDDGLMSAIRYVRDQTGCTLKQARDTAYLRQAQLLNSEDDKDDAAP